MKKSFLQPSWSKSSKTARFHQLKPFFKGQNILDIGCAVGYKKEDWMHRNIKEVSKSIIGLDRDKEAVEEIRSMGYNVIYGNAQNFDLSQKFDLIHAGELIEHLENPGEFLSSARRHLSENGRLLITTPNALSIVNTLYASTGGLQVNNEHTCWFCEYTMKTLLERMNLEVVEIGYLEHETFNRFRRFFLKMRKFILPKKVAWNTLYVVAKKK